MIRHVAKMADTTLTLKAVKSRHLFLVILLGAKGLSLKQSFVVLILEVFNRHHFVSFECVAHNFMCVQTLRAHKSSTIKAVMDIGAGLVTVATTDVCSIATLSNGKDIQQTVVKKTGWQRFEAISFWQVDFCVTLGASKFSMSLAHSCVFFQTLTAKRMKTRYNFRFFEGLETN